MGSAKLSKHAARALFPTSEDACTSANNPNHEIRQRARHISPIHMGPSRALCLTYSLDSMRTNLCSRSASRLLKGCGRLMSLTVSLASPWHDQNSWSDEILVLSWLQFLRIGFELVLAAASDPVNLLIHIELTNLLDHPHFLFSARCAPPWCSRSPTMDSSNICRPFPALFELHVGLLTFTKASLLQNLRRFPALMIIGLDLSPTGASLH
ncbi:hypothetical protein K438DRAFT_126064 [Mycena galopus ATCC 62051]|nr:hypothetical protein K438DRAFT_126064 [Mycena galopus ATCC 62051]